MHVGAEREARGAVRITRTSDGAELYFPPLRTPEVAAALGAFGAIATLISGIAMLGLGAGSAGDGSSLLSAALMAGFVLPFFAFGAIFVALAFYMVANALLVHIRPEGIETARILFGVVIKRRGIARNDIASVDAEIASRYQSVFSADPIYQLVARGRDRTRIVVGESLKGESTMAQIKALIENPMVD